METEASTTSQSMMTSGPMSNLYIRRVVYSALGIRTMADILPEPLHMIVHSGKLSIAFFLGGYVLIVGLWLPFWIFSFLVGEIGVYCSVVLSIFMIGRGIIRMIAFPGSSSRVSSEIEKEFSKYSVRMVMNSVNTLVDLAVAVSAAGRGEASRASYFEIVQLWNRTKSYRDRVLGVHGDVLHYILNDGQQSCHPQSPDLTKYSHNRLSGDIGDLSGLTEEACADGKLLMQKVSKVLSAIDQLEAQAKPLLENKSGNSQPASMSVLMVANALGMAASELRDFVESLMAGSGRDQGDGDEGGDPDDDSLRRPLEERGGTLRDAVTSGLSSILPMLDPPLGKSIFGFDLLRGCMLSKYRGSRQIWVKREDGGKIDVIHIPAKAGIGSLPRPGKKAVLYCNPNAGLIEVAAGIGLSGGNLDPDSDGSTAEKCWTDFYTNAGFDVYLFNYAGFGRSYGIGYCGVGKRGGDEVYIPGALGRIKRILQSTFCGFKPTPDTMRADGLTVASHIISQLGVETLVIHGESIGGVAASATAKQLSQSALTKDKLALLICDRTFCNLEAVAQRLVGGWSGYAIRALTPLWSTDVANDFIAAACPKIVANDSADNIIFDSASLKAGIAFWKEIHRGACSTNGVGWMMEAPIQYRMAVDYENVSVNASKYAGQSSSRLTPPLWPQDKHISLDEGFHFAACVKRIGKLASVEKKRFISLDVEAATTGIECPSPIFQVWKFLGTCEGLCGAALGIAVKGGYDVTVAWLCCLLTFGGQTVVEGIEHRHKWTDDQARTSLAQLGNVVPTDFDCRPPGFESQESGMTVHPKPIPEVIEGLKSIIQENPADAVLTDVSHELGFVLGTLEYAASRLGSQAVIEASFKDRHLQATSQEMIGSFLNLHCGHNNPYSVSEKERLRALLMHTTRTSVASQ